MIGGDLEAEGGFGCIFNPALNKKGQEMIGSKYASKIQKYDESAINEINIGKVIKNINGYLNHFSPVLYHSKIHISKSKTNLLNKCSIIKKKNQDTYVNMKMVWQAGGPFVDFIVKRKNTKEVVNHLILSYNHLLRSIKILIENNILHYDIKGNNILLQENLKLPILIDFGLSINMKQLLVPNVKMKTLKYNFYVFAPDYFLWPLEVHYISYLLNENDRPDDEDIRDIAKKCVYSNKALYKNFSPRFLEDYENECIKTLMQYKKNTDTLSIIKELLQNWITWDNYSLSIMYLRFLYYLNINGYIENIFIENLTELLLTNIHPNPKKRLDIDTTLLKFNQSLYEKATDIKVLQTVTNLFIDNRKKINLEVKKGEKQLKNLKNRITEKRFTIQEKS